MSQIAKATHDQQMSKVSAMLSKRLPELGKALLGTSVSPERFKLSALRAIGENPKLLECDPKTLWLAVFDAAMLSLELGSAAGLAYVIPYGSSAVLVISYKGQLARCRQLGMTTYKATAVHEGDIFVEQPLSEFGFEFTPHPKNQPRTVTHYIVKFEFKDAKPIFHWMSMDEINRHKEQYSKSWKKKDSPWQGSERDREKMAIKTVIRDAFNSGLLPLYSTDHDGSRVVLAQEDSQTAPVEYDIVEPAEPAQVDPVELVTRFRNCADHVQVDQLRKELTEQYPEHKQDIWDAAEIRGEQIVEE